MKLQLYFVAAALFMLAGCTKDDDQLFPDPFYPTQETFKAPIFIEVYTPEGLRVNNAKVMLGTREGYTDASGLVYFDEAIVGASAYLTVEKEGYFHASRRFYASPGKAQYIRIILLSSARIAFFNTGDGAVLPVEDHATLRFPQNGYVLDNGDEYNGVVVVAAKTIAADDPDLSFKMPGDLVGVNSDGHLGAMGSLGMITVEMRTASGDKVKFKEGIEATLEMIIPAAMADKAPSTIPLWYFDEDAGVWKEEGVAARSGDRYVGQVKHFSFWNCDEWFETVSWGASFSYEDGSPASQVKVCIDIESLGTSSCAYTDAGGVVRGMVAAKEKLGLKVFGKCDQEIYAANIGPYTNEHFFGPVAVSDPTAQSHVSGIAVDCQLKPLTNGYVRISSGNNSQYCIPDSQTGAFEAVLSGCASANITVLAFNPADETSSKPLTFPFLSDINVDSLFTCDGLEEFAVVYIEGFANPLYFDSLDIGFDEYTFIRAVGPGGATFGISFLGASAGDYFAQDEPTIRGFVDSIQIRNAGPLLVSVEKYGQIGEYVTGSFQGKVNTSEHDFIPEYQMTGRFSVKREK